MIRRLLLLLLLASSTMATPTLVSFKSGGHPGSGVAAGNNFVVTYGGSGGKGSLSGNLLVWTFTYITGTTFTSFVDNLSSTYDCTRFTDSGSGGWIKRQCFTTNTGAITSGTVTLGSTTADFTYTVEEFSGIVTTSNAAAADGGCTSNDQAGNTMQCDSTFTPGTDGDLIVASYTSTSNSSQLCNVSSTSVAAGSGTTTFTLMGAQLVCDTGDEYGVQATHAAINPFFTRAGSTDNSDFIAAAFKAAATGTNPTGVYVAHEASIQSVASADVFQFPSTGNLLVAAASPANINAAGGNIITIDTCTPSDTWTKRTFSTTTPQILFVPTASTATTLKCTIHNGNVSTASTLMHYYDVVGVGTSPEDANAHATGTESSTSVNDAPDITVAGSGIIFICLSLGTGPSTAATTSGSGLTVVYDNTTYTNETDTGFMNNGDGWQHIFYTSPATVAVNWTVVNNSSVWGAFAISFKAPTVGSTPAINKKTKLDRLDSGLL